MSVFEEKFKETIKHLEAYKKEYGHFCPPAKYVCDDGFPLGSRVSSLRVRKRKGQIKDYQVQQLRRLKGWLWDPLDHAYEVGFKRLQAYIKKHGTSRVPEGFVDRTGYNLAVFVADLRKTYKGKTRGLLTAERIHYIEQLPDWSWAPYVDDWESMFQDLLQHYQEYGTTRTIKKGYPTRRGIDLSYWVSNQRKDKKRLWRCDRQRYHRLESFADWTWNVPETVWNDWYAHVCSYAEKHGDACVPQLDQPGTPEGLGKWVSMQRTKYKKGTLNKKRERLLSALPGWQWTHTYSRWKEYMRMLSDYVDYHGHSAVPYKYQTEEGDKLGVWVSKLKRDIKQNCLRREVREALKEVQQLERYRTEKSIPLI